MNTKQQRIANLLKECFTQRDAQRAANIVTAATTATGVHLRMKLAERAGFIPEYYANGIRIHLPTLPPVKQATLAEPKTRKEYVAVLAAVARYVINETKEFLDEMAKDGDYGDAEDLRNNDAVLQMSEEYVRETLRDELMEQIAKQLRKSRNIKRSK